MSDSRQDLENLLLEKLQLIERRLSVLETRLQISPEKHPPEIHPALVETQVSPAAVSQPPLPPRNKKGPTPALRPQENIETIEFEDGLAPSLNSSSLLAFIGIAFVILAGVFFIRLTIESGWLTPIRQILLASATGVGFLTLPHLAPRAEKAYGALLAGAGTAILHLTWLGAYGIHHLLDTNTALLCATIVGIGSVLTNFDKGSRGFLLVAMAGTYLAAPIVGYFGINLAILAIFLVIWNISFSAAGFYHERRDIIFIASYYAIFSVLILSEKSFQVGDRSEFLSELLILQITQFFIFATSMTTFSILFKKPLDADESFALLPLLLMFYFSSSHLLEKIQPSFGPYFGIAFGACILLIYFIARAFLVKNDEVELTSGRSLTTLAVIAFVHSIYFQLLDTNHQALVSLVLGAVLAATWPSLTTKKKEFLWPVYILFGTFLYGALLSVFNDKYEFAPFINLAFGGLALFAIRSHTNRDRDKDETPVANSLSLILVFAHLEMMLGLYRVSLLNSELGAIFVSISWGLYALLILGLGYWKKDSTIGKSALTILLAVSLKALFYDLGMTGNLTRVICLFAEGLILYGCGWVFKKMKSWN
jgi:uncharacterized membrane protein